MHRVFALIISGWVAAGIITFFYIPPPDWLPAWVAYIPLGSNLALAGFFILAYAKLCSR